MKTKSYPIRIYKTHGKRVPMSKYVEALANGSEGYRAYHLVTDLTCVPKKKRIPDFTEKEFMDIYNY